MRRPDELPPGQQLAAAGKWPLVGEKTPREIPQLWTVELCGLVARPRTWTLDELAALPRVERSIDVHCVTRWTKFSMLFGGVPLSVLLDACEPLVTARYASFVSHSVRDHSTSLPLDVCRALDVLIAFDAEGQPLSSEHGGPVRTITPGRYFYKSLKWLKRIELLADDRLGYWEAEAGYHNEADPWREHR
jgi:DMSO/TMAO reductase YedYZ molybdopterin-dependent catalytic subunit